MDGKIWKQRHPVSWLSELNASSKVWSTAVKTLFGVASHQHFKTQLRVTLEARSFFRDFFFYLMCVVCGCEHFSCTHMVCLIAQGRVIKTQTKVVGTEYVFVFQAHLLSQLFQ